MASPPFANLSAYAAEVTVLVPDTKGGYTETDHVVKALERYTERYPCWESTDIGDASTKDWRLSTTAPFTGFVLGYSESFEIEVEELDSSGATVRPRRYLHLDRDWWLDRRTTSGVPALWLCFRVAPPASKVRVHWRRRWVVNNAAEPTNEVPVHHQLAVVYMGAAFKCRALASWYRRTVDPASGSDYFAGLDVATGYESDAKKWEAEFERVLAVGNVAHLTAGVCDPHRLRVFP